MTTTLMPQHEVATGEPSLFDSLSRLVPSELQREYYRVLAHTRSLNPDDEMLKILEAMGILALITRHTPADIAAERERIQEMLDIHLQFAGEAQQRMLKYNQLLESRLAALPSEVEEGLNPEKVSKLLGESLRQHLAQTGIEDAANALQQTASMFSNGQKRSVGAFAEIADPRVGVVARVEDANRMLDSLLQARIKKLDYLLGEFKSDLLRIWIPMVVAASLLLGLYSGMSIQRYRDAPADPPATQSGVPGPPSAQPLPQDEPHRMNKRTSRDH